MTRTPRCELAIENAKKTCLCLGDPQLTSAHLVLGLVTLNGGVGDTVLKRSGLSVETIERYLSSERTPAEESVEHGGAAFGRSAADALFRAEQEAARLGHHYLGVDHLTLSLLAEERGGAAELFVSVKAQCAKMREIILQALK